MGKEGKKGKAGQLAQPSCSMVGLGTLFLETPGNFAVLIHGDVDCINPFLRVFPFRLAPDFHDTLLGSQRFYSTALNETDVVTGVTGKRALETIELVSRSGVDQIFLLGSCLSEMIGEDLEEIAREADRRFGVSVTPLSTGGLRLKSQPELLDWFSELMLTNVPLPESTDPKALTLVGYPALRPMERAELERVLALGDLRLAAELPSRTSVERWKLVASASTHVVADRRMFPRLMGRLEQSGSLLELPPPVGVGPTRQFYTAILDSFSTSNGPLAEMEGEATLAVTRLAEPLRGRKVAYILGSSKNYEAGSLALEGMGDLAAFLEMGMEVVVMVQERETDDGLSKIGGRLSQLGFDLPFVAFNDPVVLPEALARDDFSLVYGPDHLSNQARLAGIAFLKQGRMRPGFAGMLHNVKMVIGSLSSGFSGRYGRYLRK